MAFTYLGTLATDRDKVRFYIHDVTSGSGPLPSDANFTDAEIDGLVTAEGSWERAVAAGFETLAAAWRKFPDFTADGLSLRRGQIADGYAEEAAKWRKSHGISTSSGRAGARAVTRIDGYSSTVTSHEV